MLPHEVYELKNIISIFSFSYGYLHIVLSIHPEIHNKMTILIQSSYESCPQKKLQPSCTYTHTHTHTRT